ncbi:hypothetical protein AB1484_37205 [Parafrankia sp. FMc6]|uniref:hypothetical protein n=1 Tax=Parafrankia soli TaxID=2599596 RepID=UPI0034D44DD6
MDDLADRFQDRASMIDQGAVQIEENHIRHRDDHLVALVPDARGVAGRTRHELAAEPQAI